MARVLISAYACEPNKGSEPEVGWQWTLNIAKFHEVWVLTKDNNKETIQNYLSRHQEIDIRNIHFIYVGFSKFLTFWKKKNRGMRPYYFLWQLKAFYIAKKLHKKIHFDLVHSITFVSLTQPCFLYKLGIPFVWTVAGGENIPEKIEYPFLVKEKLYEIVRNIVQWKTKYSLRVNKAVNKASLILAATEETKKLISDRYLNKVVITSAIGIGKRQKMKVYNDKDYVCGLIIGKFIYFKGVDIGIKAAIKVIELCPNVKFDILGNGPHGKQYRELCKDYIGTRINFIDSVAHDDIYNFYRQHDFLINTALRDSGCLVAMEAMSVGLPIVCIDTGGVKEMTSSEYAIKIKPDKYDLLVENLADSVLKLINDQKLRKTISKEAYYHINEKYLYEKKVEWLINEYEKILKGKKQ